MPQRAHAGDTIAVLTSRVITAQRGIGRQHTLPGAQASIGVTAT